jgi:hypothetical protein
MKKALGIFLIIVGLAALLTPLTPGSGLIIVGLELIGIRLVFMEKLKRRFKKDAPKNDQVEDETRDPKPPSGRAL